MSRQLLVRKSIIIFCDEFCITDFIRLQGLSQPSAAFCFFSMILRRCSGIVFLFVFISLIAGTVKMALHDLHLYAPCFLVLPIFRDEQAGHTFLCLNSSFIAFPSSAHVFCSTIPYAVSYTHL